MAVPHCRAYKFYNENRLMKTHCIHQTTNSPMPVIRNRNQYVKSCFLSSPKFHHKGPKHVFNVTAKLPSVPRELIKDDLFDLRKSVDSIERMIAESKRLLNMPNPIFAPSNSPSFTPSKFSTTHRPYPYHTPPKYFHNPQVLWKAVSKPNLGKSSCQRKMPMMHASLSQFSPKLKEDESLESFPLFNKNVQIKEKMFGNSEPKKKKIKLTKTSRRPRLGEYFGNSDQPNIGRSNSTRLHRLQCKLNPEYKGSISKSKSLKFKHFYPFKRKQQISHQTTKILVCQDKAQPNQPRSQWQNTPQLIPSQSNFFSLPQQLPVKRLSPDHLQAKPNLSIKPRYSKLNRQRSFKQNKNQIQQYQWNSLASKSRDDLQAFVRQIKKHGILERQLTMQEMEEIYQELQSSGLPLEKWPLTVVEMVFEKLRAY